MDTIKTPKVERVLLYRPHHKSRAYVPGTLCLTDRHIIFLEPTALDETWVLYHHILTVDRLSLTTKGYPILIITKTFQHVNLIIPRESDCTDVLQTIKQLAQPEKYTDLYAFKYRPSSTVDVGVAQTLGWNLYDSAAEYNRMGIPNNLWKHIKLNLSYEMCESYSSVLYVPSSMETSTILGCAKFRSKGRLPVLSYYHSHRQSALCRCSQPLSYITRRSVDDEQMIQAIVDANPHSSFLYLMDNRPKLNAVANKAARKGGYESTDNYPNVHYQFCNIHNIHVMRESLQKVTEGLQNSTNVSSTLSVLENSSWLKHIHLLLEAAVFIAKAMHYEGISVVVHCSDGWDRTSQTCGLTSLILDPFYRTVHGFMVLIEKDWLSFGHKFSIRCGHLSGDPSDVSPIFTQFIDCVWQMKTQFPAAFQFNELFLITLHTHLFSCQFGTFLGNCERERQKLKLSEHTYSLWGYMWSHLDEYINPLYQPDTNNGVLFPMTSISHLSFWRGLYCGHVVEAHPRELWEEQASSIRQQNKCIADHIKFLQQHKADLEDRLHLYRTAMGEVDETRTNSDIAPDGESTRKLSRRPRSKRIDAAEASKIVSLESTDANKLHENTEESDYDSFTESSDQHFAQNTPSSTENTNIVSQEDVSIARTSDVVRQGQYSSDETGKSHDQVVKKDEMEESQSEQQSDEETMSGKTKAVRRKRMSSVYLRDLLLHVPEMNLPWQPLRNVSQCPCGHTFSFTSRKYHCSFCGSVVCGACGSNHAPLPYQASPTPQRICKTCFKLMAKRSQDLHQEGKAGESNK